MLNIRMRKRAKQPVVLHEPYVGEPQARDS